jgi:hypothetical protein
MNHITNLTGAKLTEKYVEEVHMLISKCLEEMFDLRRHVRETGRTNCLHISTAEIRKPDKSIAKLDINPFKDLTLENLFLVVKSLGQQCL